MRKTLTSLLLLSAAVGLACTSAIVGPGRSATGRTLLWKHRDTSHPLNYVARVDRPGRIPFIALFNSEDKLMEEAWVGVNEAGFAVMNTASYNLAPDTARLKDREGIVMAQALGECRTVEQFDSLLRALPRPLGVQANFGAVDSTGAGAYFETADTGFTRFDLRGDSLLIRTNFSTTGLCGLGSGRERYTAACALLGPKEKISPRFLTDTVSTSYWPLKHAPKAGFKDRGQFIPRKSTSASVVIDGKTMIIRPGLPQRPGAKTYTATLDSSPAPLRSGRAWR